MRTLKVNLKLSYICGIDDDMDNEEISDLADEIYEYADLSKFNIEFDGYEVI